MLLQSPEQGAPQNDKREASPDAGPKRERGLRNFLTWSFFLAQAAAAGEFFGGSAKAGEADGADGKTAAVDALAAKFASAGLAGRNGSAPESQGGETQSASSGSAPLPQPSAEGQIGAAPANVSIDGGAIFAPGASSGGGGSQGFDAGTLIVVSATGVNINVTTPEADATIAHPIPGITVDLGAAPVADAGDIVTPVVLSPIVTEIVTAVDGAVGDITGSIGVIVPPILDGVEVILTEVVETTDSVLDTVSETLADLPGTVIEVVDSLPPIMAGVTEDLLDGAVDTVSGSLETVADLTEAVADIASDATEIVADTLGVTLDFATNALDGVIQTADTALDAVGDIADGALDLLDGITASLDIPEALDDIASSASDLVSDTLGVTVGLASDALDGVGQLGDSALVMVETIRESGFGLLTEVLDGVGEPLSLVSDLGDTVGEIASGATELVTDTLNVTGDLVESLADTVVQSVDAGLGAVQDVADSGLGLVNGLLDSDGGLVPSLVDASFDEIAFDTIPLVTDTLATAVDLTESALQVVEQSADIISDVTSLASDVTGSILDAPLPVFTGAAEVAESTGGLLDFVFDTVEVASDAVGQAPELAVDLATTLTDSESFPPIVDQTVELVSAPLDQVVETADVVTTELIEAASSPLEDVAEIIDTPLLSDTTSTLSKIVDAIPVADSLDAVLGTDLLSTEAEPSLLQTLGISESSIEVDLDTSAVASGGMLSFVTETTSDVSDFLFSDDQYTDLDIALQTPDPSYATEATVADAADEALLGGLLGQTTDVVLSTGNGLLSNLTENNQHGGGRGWLDLFG